jgi:hydroxyacylglutathione hydrolase
MIKVKIFVVNNFGVNSFVLSDNSKECVLVDPGYYTVFEQNALESYISSEGLKPVRILCTHCHVDHILGNRYVADKFETPVTAHKEDEFLLKHAVEMGNMFGIKVKPSPVIQNFAFDGDKISFGESQLEVLHVPGHSPGSIAFYSAVDKFVICGDALFNGSIGRTDLPGGDYDILIRSIKSKLLSLPPDTVIYPGHGDQTTVQREHDTNPFFT